HVGPAGALDHVGALRPDDRDRGAEAGAAGPGDRRPTGHGDRPAQHQGGRRRDDPPPPGAAHRQPLCRAPPGGLRPGLWVTNTSDCPLVSPGTRLVAKEAKATIAPVASTTGPRLGPSPCALRPDA